MCPDIVLNDQLILKLKRIDKDKFNFTSSNKNRKGKTRMNRKENEQSISYTIPIE